MSKMLRTVTYPEGEPVIVPLADVVNALATYDYLKEIPYSFQKREDGTQSLTVGKFVYEVFDSPAVFTS